MGFVLVARVNLELESQRCHDAVERADVGEEFGELVVAAHHRHLVAVRIELLARNHRNGLYRREVESHAPCRRGYILEERGDFVRGRYELAHHVQILLILRGFCLQLLYGAARYRDASLAIVRLDGIDVCTQRTDRYGLRCEDEPPECHSEQNRDDSGSDQRLFALRHVCADCHASAPLLKVEPSAAYAQAELPSVLRAGTLSLPCPRR